MEHVDQIKFKLGISGVLTEVNSWYCKSDPDNGIFGSQIDMLIARKDQVINLCEMKYSQSEYTITEKVDRSIRNKISDLRVVYVQSMRYTQHLLQPMVWWKTRIRRSCSRLLRWMICLPEIKN